MAPLLQAGSGSAFWYLALKNWVIASGIRPRVVFIFFRDTNLTDVMFRLDDQFRWSLDMVAGDREAELNDVVQIGARRAVLCHAPGRRARSTQAIARASRRRAGGHARAGAVGGAHRADGQAAAARLRRTSGSGWITCA